MADGETVKGNANAIAENSDAIDAEASARADADSALDVRLTSVESKVTALDYYGLRRRSDGVYTRTGAAATMTSARSNGTYNPTVSDFMKVRPWSDIRLCLIDKIGNVVAIQAMTISPRMLQRQT